MKPEDLMAMSEDELKDRTDKLMDAMRNSSILEMAHISDAMRNAAVYGTGIDDGYRSIHPKDFYIKRSIWQRLKAWIKRLYK